MAVTPDTVAVALGRSTPTVGEWQQWQMWIDDAQMLIDVRKAALGIEDDLPELRVDYVIREAVVAHVRRPDDATQVTVSVADATTAKTYRSARGRVEIRDEWWTLLGLTNPSSGAFAIDIVSQGGWHSDICALNFGAVYCSCGADLTGPAGYQYPLWGREF